MISLIGISGSVRSGSITGIASRGCVADAPRQQAPHRIESVVSRSTMGMRKPKRACLILVAALEVAIARADGFCSVTPEYNNMSPGVAKNAIDWLSRPPKDISRVFGGKAVAIAGASPGGFGTILSQNAWLPVFRTLGAELWSGGRFACLTRWQHHRCERRDFRPCDTGEPPQIYGRLCRLY